MFIEKLASFAQEPQRAFTGHEIFLPGVGKRKPSLTPAHKQQIQMLFESGQGPAYRGSRELEMGRRRAERSRLRCGDEYSDAIEIGRFAHVQAGCAVVIILCSASLDRKSTRLNSSHGYISYAVFCLKKKNTRSLVLTSSALDTISRNLFA